MSLSRWGALGAASLALAGCIPAADRAALEPAPPAPVAQAPTPAPGPITTPEFTLNGELEQGGTVIGTVPEGAVAIAFDGEPLPIAPDGVFLIAFDRDHGPTAVLEATLSDGRHVTKSLAVAPRAWDISRLGRLPKYPVPSEEFKRLRPPELAQIVAARAKETGAQGWRQDFIWPTTGRISTHFGAQRIYKGGEKGSYHSGTDVAVPVGTPVRAPADGVVILATGHPFTLEGNLLMLDHGMGLNSAFLHLSEIDVQPGEHVRQGQVIAQSGASGRATGPHLHWSIKWRDARIDPSLIAGTMPQ